MPRKGWNELSPALRKRYVGAARTGSLFGVPHPDGGAVSAEQAARDYYQAGGPLGAARGHKYGARRSPNAPPAKAVAAEQAGRGTAATYGELERWRKRPPSRGGPPPWLPRSDQEMSTDTAAILAQIDIPPARWASVEMVFLPDGRTVVIVTSKRGARRVVTLPDSLAASQFGTLLRSPGRLASSPAEQRRLERQWRRRAGDGIEISTTGYRASPRGRAA